MDQYLRERLIEFRDAYAKALDGITDMSRLWEDADLAELVESITTYPSYLPSFDEFLCDFQTLGDGITDYLIKSAEE